MVIQSRNIIGYCIVLDGKVTFEVFGDFFTDSGTAKLQQLQNGAKNVVFVPSDFNPDEQLQYYRIQAGK